MKKDSVLLKILSIIFIIGLAVGAYLHLIRPWQLRWGATDAELARSMPGDALLAATDFNATRAVTINATPEEIWPWIVQIGDQRAGFYGYDWFDNRFARSAEKIISEFQDLKIGDEVPISSLVSQTVWLLEPYEAMVWVGGGDEIDGTWSWGLYPLDDERTRLVTRLRGKYHWSKPTIMFNLLIEGGDLPFMRKCLLGIKQRAEGNITDTFLGDTAEGGLWFGTLFIFITALVQIFRRKDWHRPWLLALSSAVAFQLIFYVRPPLWIGGILEIGILAGLIWWRENGTLA